MADGPTASAPSYSPLPQLPAPLPDGFTLSLPTGGSDIVTPGTPSSASTYVVLPTGRAVPANFPNSVPARQRDVNQCSTLSDSAHSCGTTDLDLAAPEDVFAPGSIAGLTGGKIVTSGVAVSMATPQSRSVWTDTPPVSTGQGLTLMATRPGVIQFNTGIGCFTTRRVGHNAVAGLILVGTD